LPQGGVAMAEAETIRVLYGLCPRCAEPVRLRWTLSDDKALVTDDKGGYWKIIDHSTCREDGKKGKPAKGAKEAFSAMILRKKADRIAEKRWPPKPVSPVSGERVDQQLSLFKQ